MNPVDYVPEVTWPNNDRPVTTRRGVAFVALVRVDSAIYPKIKDLPNQGVPRVLVSERFPIEDGSHITGVNPGERALIILTKDWPTALAFVRSLQPEALAV